MKIILGFFMFCIFPIPTIIYLIVKAVKSQKELNTIAPEPKYRPEPAPEQEPEYYESGMQEGVI